MATSDLSGELTTTASDGELQPRDDDHQHGAAAPLDPRRAATAAGTGRRDRRDLQADHRLPAHGHREEHRVPHVDAGRHLRHARRLPVAVLQRARVLPGGREATRRGGTAAGPGDPGADERAQPHQLAPRVAGDRRAGTRRRQRDALRLPRARDPDGHLRGGHRTAHEPRVHPDRRRDHGPARRRHREDARGSSRRCPSASTTTRRS